MSLRPEPPQWALDAGLAAPFEDETFTEYCERIILHPDYVVMLLDGLTDQTAPVANARLASLLMELMPQAFDDALIALRARVADWNEYHERLASVRREVYN